MPSINDVAFLCYYPYKQRQDNNSFEGNYNIGANLIMDVLRRNGIGKAQDNARKLVTIFRKLTKG